MTIAFRDSFSARRGEFVRIAYQERRGDVSTDVLGRILSISRQTSCLTNRLGREFSEIEILPSTKISGETVFGKIELVGYKDPLTGEIRIPRRPLDPGSKVYGVNFEFLTRFYEFSEDTSIHIGNLVGYERGENIVPVYLDINLLTTEHLAVLAMTGAGKSYTVGRIIERMVAQKNASVLVFDPHGEYGKALKDGQINFNIQMEQVQDPRDRESLEQIKTRIAELTGKGGGVVVYTPQNTSFNAKYASKNKWLALQLANLDMDELVGILPGLTEAQQRVMDVAFRYWKEKYNAPHDIQDLLNLLNNLDTLKSWDKLSPGESNALKEGSANIAAIRLRRMINEAQSFYSAAVGSPTDVGDMVGAPGQAGRIAIVDLQGLTDTARQLIVALISSEILKAASNRQNPIRPVFIVYEEGHNFAPAGEINISKNVIKRIASEGRKFGVGFAIISQRPSKLDSDVTSQCNTIIAMRIKNPDDQRFIQKTSDYFSAADLAELPSLSTGEALICGRAILAPIVVKVGYKALVHGGEAPNVCDQWGQ